MITTPSGREALRGNKNRFGSMELEENQQKQMFKKHRQLLGRSDTVKNTKGLEDVKQIEGDFGGDQSEEELPEVEKEFIGVPSEEEFVNYSGNFGTKFQETKFGDGYNLFMTDDPRSSSIAPVPSTIRPPKKPAEALGRSTGDEQTPVFAKIRGYPAWPATVLALNPDKTATVQFQDGRTGENAVISEFSQENLKKFASKEKFKKSCSKYQFLKEAANLGLL